MQSLLLALRGFVATARLHTVSAEICCGEKASNFTAQVSDDAYALCLEARVMNMLVLN